MDNAATVSTPQMILQTLQNPPPDLSGDDLRIWIESVTRVGELVVAPAQSKPRQPKHLSAAAWHDMPEFPKRNPRVDNWFVAFEAVMTSNHVEESEWAAKLVECPKYPLDLKRQLNDIIDKDNKNLSAYTVVRRRALKRFGPPFAVLYFRQQIAHVQGTDRDLIYNELYTLLTLHNRAAKDCDFPLLEEDDLMYAFVNAFPETERHFLQSHLDQIEQTKEDPFQSLYSIAPESASMIAAVHQKVSSRDHTNSRGNRPRPSGQTSTNATSNKRPRQNCRGCGKDCSTRQSCPAYTVNCGFCQQVGHYKRVCMKMQRMQGDNGNPNFDRVTNDSHNNKNVNPVQQSRVATVACVVGHRAEVPVRISNIFFKALVDTGASISFILTKAAQEAKLALRPCRLTFTQADGSTLLHVAGEALADFTLGALQGQHKFVIADKLTSSVILGLDFMSAFGIGTEPKHNHVTIQGHGSLKFLMEPICPILSSTPPAITSTNHGVTKHEYAINADLNPGQTEKLRQSIYTADFASDACPFGCVQGVEHHILLSDPTPIRTRLRRTSPHEREIVRKEIVNMIAQNVIKPSTSPWASAIVLVKKKDGTTRFCIDFRPINKVTIKDRYPLPSIDSMLAALSGAAFFSKLDAASGYWQIPMAEESVQKTAFICQEGLFEFNKMPFGLCNAGATFQRTMDEILSDLLGRGVFVYIDDILVYATTFEEHVRLLREVLMRLKNKGLKLKAKKCAFGLSQTEFTGFIVSDKGIHPDESKVDKFKTFPVPTNAKEMRAFIGLGSYYRRFIPRFASIAAPLHDLTAQTEWVWEEKHQTAFEQIKHALNKNAVNRHPNFQLPFIVDTDASQIGMSAIVSQIFPNQGEMPVAIDSRKFTAAEKKWHIRELEALAIVWGLERFQYLLMGSDFIIRSDHSNLQWLLDAKAGRLQRWALRLSPFGPLKIQHRKGKLHSNADAFTRVFADSDTMEDHAFVCTLNNHLLATQEELLEAQKNCEHSKNIQTQSRSSVMRDGVVGIKCKGSWRAVLPPPLAITVAKRFHESEIGGHMGARKLLAFLHKRYIIPRGITATETAVRACLTCMQRKPPKQKLGLLKSRPPQAPWHTVAMDFCGPYCPSTSGNLYVLVFIDQFTKYVELIPTADQAALTVVDAFHKYVICRWGAPEFLLSDNGPSFRAALVSNLCSAFSIRKIFSSAYYPQGDGYAERMMRTMNDSLSALSRNDTSNWDKYIPGLALAYNMADHGATGYSPLQLNTGRVVRLPGEEVRSAAHDATAYCSKLRNTISNALHKARVSVQLYWDAMKARYDRFHHDVQLKLGDRILVRLTDQERAGYPCKKLAPRWSGVHVVESCLSNGKTYIVKDVRSDELKTVNLDNLLPIAQTTWGDGYAPSPHVSRGRFTKRLIFTARKKETSERATPSDSFGQTRVPTEERITTNESQAVSSQPAAIDSPLLNNNQGVLTPPTPEPLIVDILNRVFVDRGHSGRLHYRVRYGDGSECYIPRTELVKSHSTALSRFERWRTKVSAARENGTQPPRRPDLGFR